MLASTAAPAATESLDRTAWHTLTGASVAGALGVDTAEGLGEAEAATRLQEYGPNRLAAGTTESRLHAFVRQYRDPMQVVLLLAGIGSIYPVNQIATGVLLIAITLLNAALRLQQEDKPAAAVSALRKSMVVKARVRRGGRLVQVPAEQIVPGDVVAIAAGDVVPADGRLTEVAALDVDESALTGESGPMAKAVASIAASDTPLGDRTDMVFMSTNVRRGTAEFVVTATGMATQVGHIAHMLEAEADTDTPLMHQLKKVTNTILLLAGGALVISLILSLARGEGFKTVVAAAIAFAVASVPAGLPVIVTAILSNGMQLLARAGVVVRRPRAVETLGWTSAITANKTGTLTLNQMTAVEMTLPGRRYTVSGSGYSSDGRIRHVAGAPDGPLDDFLEPLALASDPALVALAEKGGIDAAATRAAMPRVGELPFDAAYKLTATFHEVNGAAGRFIRAFVRGAPERLLARAASVRDADTHPVLVDQDYRARYLAESDRLASRGMRVIATGRKDLDPAEFDPYGDLLQAIDGLTLLTLVGTVDPARPEAGQAIARAKDAGIRVRMITGDQAVTAEAVARELGIEGRTITGAQSAALAGGEDLEQLDEVGVVARVTPEHRVRLVKALQSRGEVVAMAGHGVDDAPALKRADVGVAMGAAGSDVSKEAAAMVAEDESVAAVVRAVEAGREVYKSLEKYVRFQVGVLAGMIATFLGASIFNILGGVPFIPLQTLWVTFTTDVFQSIGLGSGKPSDDVMEQRPPRVDEPILDRPLVGWLAGVGLLQAVVTLCVIQWASSRHGAAIAHTMGVTVFALMNLFYSFTLRSEDRRFVYASLASVAAIVIGAQSGLVNRLIQTRPLDINEWFICIGAAASVIVVAEVRKLLLRANKNQQEDLQEG